MSRLGLLTVALATSILTVGALAGCSAGTLPGPSAASTSASDAPTTPPKAGATSGGGASPFTLPTSCLPAAEVSATLGIPAYGPSPVADSTSLVCSYLTATQDGPIIDIEAKGSLTTANFVAQVKSGAKVGATVSEVSGLGDAAAVITTANGAHVMDVLAGNYNIDIAGLGATPDALTALAKKILAE